MSYRVIDDFCPHLDAVIASAKAAGFGTWRPPSGEVGDAVYDGMGYIGDHAPMHAALMRHMGIVVPNWSFFRSTNKDAVQKAYIHSDRESGAHTCVAFLSDHDERYGTAFYRHRKTGWTSMPSVNQMRELGVFDAMKEDMISRDPAKWEETDFVSGRKNRAVIFDAPLFHSRVPVDGFGATPNDGRMVWACHFYLVAPNGEFC